MSAQVRPFAEQDYRRYVEIQNLVYPEYRESEEEIRHSDDTWDIERYYRLRLVAEDAAGVVVGSGDTGHMRYQFHPDKYSLHIRVHPEYQRRGIGGLLYSRVTDELRARGALLVRSKPRSRSRIVSCFFADAASRRCSASGSRGWTSPGSTSTGSAARRRG